MAFWTFDVRLLMRASGSVWSVTSRKHVPEPKPSAETVKTTVWESPLTSFGRLWTVTSADVCPAGMVTLWS